MCRVASQHDLAESFQLRSTEGWQTLQAILQSTGERLPKRPRDGHATTSADSSAYDFSAHHVSARDSGEPLTKRFAAFRLNERRTPNRDA